MLVPVKRYITEEDLAPEIEKIGKQLGPEVVRYRYSLGYDTFDEPSIYIRVVLAGWAATPENLGPIANKVRWAFLDGLDFRRTWGLNPYVKFRSELDPGTEPEWN